MLNLLRFEFRRLFKSVFFRIIGIYCVVWPLLITLFLRLILKLSEVDISDIDLSSGEHRFLTWMIVIGFVNDLPKFIALFECLHIGSDFSNGIVRNKIIAGHSRTAIFFSYMITQICATVAICVVYICSALLGLLITGIGVDLNHGEMFVRMGVGIMTLLVLSVLFVSLSVIFRKRALPIIFSIIIVMFLAYGSSIVGMFNTPSKAADDYIEIRHERYEELVEEGLLSDDDVKDLEKAYDKDNYLGIPWKIVHPAYLLTNLGFSGDYHSDISALLTGDLEYSKELDFTGEFASDYYSADLSGITPKDLRHVDSMHMSYDTLNLIYTGRSLIWIVLIGGWGYIIFRKRNLF